MRSLAGKDPGILDCTDGFDEASYGCPETLLDPAARQACSAWNFVDDDTREPFDRTLRRDLASGAWDDRFGHLRDRPAYGGLVRRHPRGMTGPRVRAGR
ncbi:hypothetical protein [Streptomyces zaomyceticus]|uniref:hypothetical protein n=1 Tax=Streptomyces zaomyceticus TaxID=68286 RepID=UPI0034346CF2